MSTENTKKSIKLKKQWKILIAVASVIVIALSITLPIYFVSINTYKAIANPLGLSAYKTPKKVAVEDATYYVSNKNGDDNNDGTKAAPFYTLEKAQEKVREQIANGYPQDIVVAVMGGEYALQNGWNFDEQDSFIDGKKVTYVSYNEEEVILNGGATLKANAFVGVSNNTRFDAESREKIKKINLVEQGISLAQIDKLYSIGAYAQGKKYGEPLGHKSACEIFFNDKRMDIARYPNKEYANIAKVVDYGQARENVPKEDIVDWDTAITPRPPKYTVGKDIRKRMANWQMPNSDKNAIWSYGYFYWDWADASSPITKIDKEKGQIDLAYSSPYGIKNDAKYYIYNVLEELDTAGEYYLDRENGDLYIYPTAEMEDADIQISLTTDSVINVVDTDNADEGSQPIVPKNLIFDGFTVKGTRGDAVTIDGENCKILNSLIKNSAQNGIRVRGKNNLVKNCEVTSVGTNGINVGRELGYKQGDITNDIRINGLVKENNLITNNYIHSYGEIQRTYTSGVHITGVGNTASHNEIFDAPHMGIFYEGNEHIMEYNYLHEVVQYSSDAGAIYAGRNMSYYGNEIRYNCIANIGSKEFAPSGIYFDDCLSGQTAYGNLLVNIPSNGFLIGGGRDINVYNNMIINATKPICYDARAYDGTTKNDWYTPFVKDATSRQWALMNDAQSLLNIWKEKTPDVIGTRYDAIANMVGWDDMQNVNNAVNPNGIVRDNICISKKGGIGSIANACQTFGVIENNLSYKLTKGSKLGFVDFGGGNYNLIEGNMIMEANTKFTAIPISQIGRIN